MKNVIVLKCEHCYEDGGHFETEDDALEHGWHHVLHWDDGDKVELDFCCESCIAAHYS